VLTITELDPFDDAQLREFHAVVTEADRHGRRYASPWAFEETAALLRTPSDFVRRLRVVAREVSEVVAVGGMDLPLRDNTSIAEIAVWVPPSRRRCGHGAQVARHLCAQAHAAGRTVLSAWIPGREVDAPADTVTPGEHLARSMGLRMGLLDVQRRLPLPVPADHLERLRVHAAERHDGYRFLSWVDRCPDEHADAYCALNAAMNTEAPMGDLQVENEHWDVQRLREEEQLLRDAGRTRYVVLAQAPDGTLVGHNELVVPAYDPGPVWQWDTLVVPAHRGHRLGLALKVRNIDDVQRAHPDRTDVRTFNAESNTHMIAVNEAIGFRAVEYIGEWQGPVPA